MSGTRLLSARHVVTMNSSPIENGAVVYRDDRIIDVGSKNAVHERNPGAEIIELGNHVLMPALVNAHSHIALTCAERSPSDKDFFDWLVDLISYMRKQSSHDFREYAQTGLKGMYRAGITTIGDSFYVLEPMLVLLEMGFRCVFFFEVFGVNDRFESLALWKYSRALNRSLKIQTGRVHPGISPHAPYTVTPSVLKFASGIASKNKMRVSMHVAETKGEIEFLKSTKGRFRERFEPSGRKIPQSPLKPIEYIDSFQLVNDRFLAIHGVHLSDDELNLLAKRGGHLVSCPSSNRNLQAGELDIFRAIKAGVNVSIGTDSPASSDGIDLFNELRLALEIGKRDDAQFKARDALELITVNPARALGFEKEIGDLKYGKSADIIAIRLPSGTGDWGKDIEETIVQYAKASDVMLVISSGQVRFSE